MPRTIVLTISLREFSMRPTETGRPQTSNVCALFIHKSLLITDDGKVFESVDFRATRAR